MTAASFARLVYDTPDLRIYEGTAKSWPGSEPIDFVLTNPYGPLPVSLASTPMLLHQWVHRKKELERWTYEAYLGNPIGKWNHGREAFWAVNLPTVTEVDLSEFVPELGGWWPEAMVHQLLDAYHIKKGQTVWDGFMGRGTLAKVARERGIRYVGVEELPAHIAFARFFLGLPAA